MPSDEEKPTRRRLEWNLLSIMKDSLFCVQHNKCTPTCFPQKSTRFPFLPFEQTEVLGSKYHGDEYRDKHSHNACLAREYSLKHQH